MITREEKLDTIDLVVEKCGKAGLYADLHELYVFCTGRWGCEMRKFKEYLTVLQMRKSLVVEGNQIWSYARWKKIEKARLKDHKVMVDLINKSIY